MFSEKLQAPVTAIVKKILNTVADDKMSEAEKEQLVPEVQKLVVEELQKQEDEFCKLFLESQRIAIDEPDSSVTIPISEIGSQPEALISGWVHFEGCSAAQLNDFAVIQESGPPAIHPPVNGKRYQADGFWYRHNRDYWYKIADTCVVKVECRSDGIYLSTARACSWVSGWRRADTERPNTPYPF